MGRWRTIEPINQALKRVVNVPSFKERYEAMRRDILENADVQAFLASRAEEVTMDMVEISLPKLHEYISQANTCCGCDNTENCTNYLKGFVPRLNVMRNAIEVDYIRCEQKVLEEEA